MPSDRELSIAVDNGVNVRMDHIGIAGLNLSSEFFFLLFWTNVVLHLFLVTIKLNFSVTPR